MGKQATPGIPFRQGTRKNFYPTPAPQTATAFSQKLTFLLPQTGMLANIALGFTGTITGTGAASGSWPTYPPIPYALLKQVRLYTSDSIELVNVTGWGLYMQNMRTARIQSGGTDVVSYLSTNNRALLLATASGALGAGPTTLTGFLNIPVMTDEMQMIGLLNTQSNEIRISLDLVLGSQTDIMGTGAYATTTVISFTFTPNVEIFNLPPTGSNIMMPNQSYANYLQEDATPFTLATGDWVYRPSTGMIFKGLYGVVENASVQVAPANITQVQFKYAQTVTPQQEPIAIHTGRLKQFYGMTPPDGFVDFAFSQGSGLAGFFDSRDFLNSAQVTDLQFIISVTGLSISGTTQFRAIKEQLGQM